MAGTVALDFDGVLHSSPEAQWPPAEISVDLIRQLQARGYARVTLVPLYGDAGHTPTRKGPGGGATGACLCLLGRPWMPEGAEQNG
jgi:hypothetical protein